MKITLFVFVLFFSSFAFANGKVGPCSIANSNPVYSFVEHEVFKVLNENEIKIEEGATLEEIAKVPTVHNKSAYGNGLQAWYTDVLVYEMEDWVFNQGLENDRTIFVEVSYSVEYSAESVYECLEDGTSSHHIIVSVSKISTL